MSLLFYLTFTFFGSREFQVPTYAEFATFHLANRNGSHAPNRGVTEGASPNELLSLVDFPK